MNQRTWGIWQPDTEAPLPQGSFGARPLEWWPSARAAEASLRARTPRVAGTTNIDPERRADGRTVADAQFYGGPQAVIYLYDVEGEPGPDQVRPVGEPFARLEFGPRGGIHRRLLAPAAPTREARR
ncbi:hypothetical protein ACFWBC_10350 [Streptomyces sp. NPDC059985]|uniref:hypothetical protein n=1 Tax=Streptomyces sp. NPDC059985 TaxID=3347025 RepID=UPI00368A15A6